MNADRKRGYTIYVDDKKIADDLQPGMIAVYKGKIGEVRVNIYAKREVYTGWIVLEKGLKVQIVPYLFGVDLTFFYKGEKPQ